MSKEPDMVEFEAALAYLREWAEKLDKLANRFM